MRDVCTLPVSRLQSLAYRGWRLLWTWTSRLAVADKHGRSPGPPFSRHLRPGHWVNPYPSSSRLHLLLHSAPAPPAPPRSAPLAVGPAQIRRAALPAPPRQAQGKAHLVYSGARIGGNEMRERFAAPPPRPHGRLRGLFSLEADCSCKLQLLVFLDTNACRLAFGLALCLKVGGRRRVRRSCTGRTNLQDLGLGWFAC